MTLTHRIVIPTKHFVSEYKGSWKPVPDPTLAPAPEYLQELKDWCKTNVGVNGWNYYGCYRKIPYEFRFKQPEDLLAFKLRFGF